MLEDINALSGTILTLLDAKDYPRLRDLLISLNEVDIAHLFENLPSEKLPLLFRLLPKEEAAESFVEMDGDMQELLIRGISDNELKEVLDELYLDDAVDIVEEMPANVVKRILANTDPDTRKMINEILKYPEDSAGSIMTIEYVSLRPFMTVADSIKRIRRTGVDKETIYTCYVTDDSRHLLGVIDVKTLLLTEEDALINDLMQTNVIRVKTLDDKELVANNFNIYSLLSMPVVDEENRLVGIVTVDDAIEVLTEEATEDIKKMAAILPSEKPYLKLTPVDLWKARIPWLLLLMISATFTSSIIASFQDALQASLVLTAFIPMLMDTCGNAGSQASVTIIRSISLGEISFHDVCRVVLKESMVALLCGITLAVANFIKLLLFDKLTVVVALVICLTILVAVFAAKIVGCLLPLITKALGFDPAVMASPFITTIVDALSLLVYFRIATILLHL